MNLPPVRPGYNRDPDPEGRWEGQYSDEIGTERSGPTVVYNWPAILFTALGVVLGATMIIPINILLWRWAL